MVRGMALVGAAALATVARSAPVPGYIEAEDFSAVSYYDSTPENEGGSPYRAADAPEVDINACSIFDPFEPLLPADELLAQQCSGGLSVNYIAPGEYLLYDIENLSGKPLHYGMSMGVMEGVVAEARLLYHPVPKGGKTCADVEPVTCLVVVDGEMAAGPLPKESQLLVQASLAGEMGATWYDFETVMTQEALDLPAGPGCLQFCMDAGELMLDTLLAYAPFDLVIPGVIEAEEFDRLGAGISYMDTTFLNKGGFVGVGARPDAPSVDLEYCAEGDGVICSNNANVNWPTKGEWLRYTATAEAGLYDVTLYASTIANAVLKDPAARLLVSDGDCVDSEPIVGCPAVGPDGVQVLEATFEKLSENLWDFNAIVMGQVELLAAGDVCMQLCFLNEKFHTDYLEFELVPEVTEAPATEAPATEEPFVEEPVVEKPVVEKPVVEKPVVEKPAANEKPVVKDEEVPKKDETPAEDVTKQGSPDDNSNSSTDVKTIGIAVGASVAGALVLLGGVVMFKKSRASAPKGASSEPAV